MIFDGLSVSDVLSLIVIVASLLGAWFSFKKKNLMALWLNVFVAIVGALNIFATRYEAELTKNELETNFTRDMNSMRDSLATDFSKMDSTKSTEIELLKTAVGQANSVLKDVRPFKFNAEEERLFVETLRAHDLPMDKRIYIYLYADDISSAQFTDQLQPLLWKAKWLSVLSYGGKDWQNPTFRGIKILCSKEDREAPPKQLIGLKAAFDAINFTHYELGTSKFALPGHVAIIIGKMSNLSLKEPEWLRQARRLSN